ncbi:MAG: protein TolR [Burkholderiales bacterium]
MRQRKLMNQINIVPYVDVMMVLLVIFMVTAPLVNPGVIDLPTVGKSSQQDQVVPPLEVIVRRDTSLMLREREREPGAKAERDVTMPELIAIVKARQAARPDQPVVISADKDVKYDAVLKVMDEMQKLDVKRVGLMVKPAAQ